MKYTCLLTVLLSTSLTLFSSFVPYLPLHTHSIEHTPEYATYHKALTDGDDATIATFHMLAEEDSFYRRIVTHVAQPQHEPSQPQPSPRPRPSLIIATEVSSRRLPDHKPRQSPVNSPQEDRLLSSEPRSFPPAHIRPHLSSQGIWDALRAAMFMYMKSKETSLHVYQEEWIKHHLSELTTLISSFDEREEAALRQQIFPLIYALAPLIHSGECLYRKQDLATIYILSAQWRKQTINQESFMRVRERFFNLHGDINHDMSHIALYTSEKHRRVVKWVPKLSLTCLLRILSFLSEDDLTAHEYPWDNRFSTYTARVEWNLAHSTAYDQVDD